MKRIQILLYSMIIMFNCFSQSETMVNIDNSDVKQIQDSSAVFIMVENMPNFLYKNQTTCEKSFEKYMVDSLVIAENIKCSGSVYIQIIIEKDGSIENVKIIRELPNCKKNDIINSEIIRVVKQMPKWKPGEHNGASKRILKTLQVKID